ncbi:hypothetical protein V9T40_000594 [Parthenolecanium corni]|uniref:UDP-glucuronosyltransferase n=1 Tax=Parthenolecanium corni TaxID=536013 RepID=A0AAN9TBX4_9HEMI
MIQPIYAKSHDNFHTAVARSLLSAGHYVTFITPFPESIKHSNYTAINCGDPTDVSGFTNKMSMGEALQMSSDSMALLKFGLEELQTLCPLVIQLDEVQKILQSQTKLFDVVILETILDLHECFLPVADKFDIPIIGAVVPRSWLSTEWMMGNPSNPALYPSVVATYSYPMTFLQRLDNFWNLLLDFAFHNYYTYPQMKEFYKKFFGDDNFSDRRKMSLVFLNNHQVLTPRPIVPTIINVGGLQIQPAKPLPENLKTFIDGAEHGVILFSIGSFVQSYNMPSEMLAALRKTFAQIPQRVIWKAEKRIEGLSENVLVSKWLPQRDILAHKNIVAFISHCGIAGTYESLYNGIPMVLMPIFADQIANAELLQRLGVGPKIYITNLTTEKLLNALNDVINGTKYRQRTTEISELIKDQPMSPQESVVYWTEYVIRHNGAKHLQSPGAEMPLYQYLLLDVIGKSNSLKTKKN